MKFHLGDKVCLQRHHPLVFYGRVSPSDVWVITLRNERGNYYILSPSYYRNAYKHDFVRAFESEVTEAHNV